jgi:hypothetical protein
MPQSRDAVLRLPLELDRVARTMHCQSPAFGLQRMRAANDETRRRRSVSGRTMFRTGREGGAWAPRRAIRRACRCGSTRRQRSACGGEPVLLRPSAGRRWHGIDRWTTSGLVGLPPRRQGRRRHRARSEAVLDDEHLRGRCGCHGTSGPRSGRPGLLWPTSYFDAGRMAICTDPLGARFAIWESAGHVSPDVMHEPGSFTWCELTCGMSMWRRSSTPPCSAGNRGSALRGRIGLPRLRPPRCRAGGRRHGADG